MIYLPTGVKKTLTKLGFIEVSNKHPFSKDVNGFQISSLLQELSDLILCLQPQKSKWYHLHIGCSISKSHTKKTLLSRSSRLPSFRPSPLVRFFTSTQSTEKRFSVAHIGFASIRFFVEFFANASENKTWSVEKNKNPSGSIIYAIEKSVTTWTGRKMQAFSIAKFVVIFLKSSVQKKCRN